MQEHVECTSYQQKSLSDAFYSVSVALEKQRKLGIADQLGVTPSMIFAGVLSRAACQQRFETTSEGVTTPGLARG